MTSTTNSKYYTGVGSRETPKDTLQIMFRIAKFLAKEGYTLRSGGADGADTAFELGAVLQEIYLPWENFNNRVSRFYTTPNLAYEIAARIHPNWSACSRGARALHARNICQVLGCKLETPADFLVCWCKLDKKGEPSGGTRTAIKCAEENKVPVFNLFTNSEEEFYEWYNKICNQ